jgi:hypothetical protein
MCDCRLLILGVGDGGFAINSARRNMTATAMIFNRAGFTLTWLPGLTKRSSWKNFRDGRQGFQL